MANLKETLLSLVDVSTRQTKNIIDSMNETLNSIDWDSQIKTFNDMKDSFLKKSNEILGEFNDLLKEVKNNITDFEVIVPYDMALGEKFDYTIEGNKLIVEVTFEDENSERSNKTTVTIPQNCDTAKLKTRYNSVNKTMTVIIPKVIAETKEEPKEEKKEEKKASTTYKLRTAATPKKETVKKEQTPEEHQAASKLLKKFKESTSGLKRDARGRFVKHTAE
jgi:hypothetical protein